MVEIWYDIILFLVYCHYYLHMVHHYCENECECILIISCSLKWMEFLLGLIITFACSRVTLPEHSVCEEFVFSQPPLVPPLCWTFNPLSSALWVLSVSIRTCDTWRYELLFFIRFRCTQVIRLTIFFIIILNNNKNNDAWTI